MRIGRVRGGRVYRRPVRKGREEEGGGETRDSRSGDGDDGIIRDEKQR
jgi:hypothetical protein